MTAALTDSTRVNAHTTLGKVNPRYLEEARKRVASGRPVGDECRHGHALTPDVLCFRPGTTQLRCRRCSILSTRRWIGSRSADRDRNRSAVAALVSSLPRFESRVNCGPEVAHLFDPRGADEPASDAAQRHEQAARFCVGCPARAECAQWTAANSASLHGVWCGVRLGVSA